MDKCRIENCKNAVDWHFTHFTYMGTCVPFHYCKKHQSEVEKQFKKAQIQTDNIIQKNSNS